MEIYIELLHAIIDHLYLVVTHHPSKNQKQKNKNKSKLTKKKRVLGPKKFKITFEIID